MTESYDKIRERECQWCAQEMPICCKAEGKEYHSRRDTGTHRLCAAPTRDQVISRLTSELTAANEAAGRLRGVLTNITDVSFAAENGQAVMWEIATAALSDTPPAPKPLDLNSETPAGLPLTIGVEEDQLVIRIGVDTLAFCFEISEDNQPYDDEAQDFRRAWHVTDRHEFAKGVAIGLRVEKEDGSTPLTDILDAACIRAIEDDMGIEEDGRIVTDEMLHPSPPVPKPDVCGTCGHPIAWHCGTGCLSASRSPGACTCPVVPKREV